MATITSEQVIAGHAKSTARHRLFLRFIREHTTPGTEPDFVDIAKKARAAGLYSMNTMTYDIANRFAITWRRRDYYDRLADKQWRCGVELPLERTNEPELGEMGL